MFSEVINIISEQINDISSCDKYLREEIKEIVEENNLYCGSYNSIMFDIRDLVYNYHRNKTINKMSIEKNISVEEARAYYNDNYVSHEFYVCTNWSSLIKDKEKDEEEEEEEDEEEDEEEYEEEYEEEHEEED
jgi:hypothetical protein